MATYTISNLGNTALQTEVWTLSIPEAKTATAFLVCSKGSYWHATLAQPMRRAIRAGKSTVRCYTAGFSSGELSNVLAAHDISVAQAA